MDLRAPRAAGVLWLAMIALAAPAHAQLCAQPTAATEIAFEPLRSELELATPSLEEIARAAPAIAAVVPIASPNLGFIQFTGFDVSVSIEARFREHPDAGRCGTIERVVYRLGVKKRRLVMAREFAADACLDRWIRANLGALDAWEDALYARAGKLAEPMTAIVRALDWSGGESEEQVNQRVQQAMVEALGTAGREIIAQVRAGRADYFARMQTQLDAVCEGRGAALLRTIGSRAM